MSMKTYAEFPMQRQGMQQYMPCAQNAQIGMAYPNQPAPPMYQSRFANDWHSGTMKAAQVNPDDFSRPWFYAAKMAGLIGVILVSVMSIGQTLGLW